MAAAGAWFWIPHPEECWVPGRFKGGDEYETNSGVVKVSEAQRGVEISDLAELDGVNDCCSLDNVTSASILHTTRVRYYRGEIYTNISDVLVAINPFKSMNIYGQEQVDLYSEAQDTSEHPPHIFGLCSRAFAGLFDTSDGTKVNNQAVLISGESGAGKTETTKFVLLYTSDQLASSGAAGGIEDLLLEFNPLLEAFGNAKTVRNNNSSRFGKWIEVRVDPAARSIRGVSIIEYLLEVTRVCGQGNNERNYHIFYQLAKNASLKKSLKLEDAASSNYLKANGMEITGVDDAREFAALKKALTALQFSEEDESQLFRVVAGILHIGNLDFKPGSETEVTNTEVLKTAAELLGVPPEALAQCIVKKQIVTVGETVMQDLEQDQAYLARDSMSKLIYKFVFAWLVKRCNDAIGSAVAERLLDESARGGGPDQFLGVLDIAGFESFEKNLLEQLLINLSNEKLQQFFNTAVFKSEIAEYTAEGLDIKSIDWADNTEVLNLIEGPGGVLSMLDDATTGVRQTDETLVARLIKEKVKHPNFLKQKKFDPLAFGIKHYAGEVFYNGTGFLVKNSSQTPLEILELLANSSMKLLQEVVEPDTAGTEIKTSGTHGTLNTGAKSRGASPRPGAGGGKKKGKATNAGAYKRSLQQLMDKLGTAHCHFVRCIKPNSTKTADNFNGEMVMDQLRLSGVMETVEIRKAGYPHRSPYSEFNGRYLMILPKEERKKLKGSKDVHAVSKAILDVIAADAIQSALGKTKVFLKLQIHKDLEAARLEAFKPFTIDIQAAYRGYKIRKQMVEVRAVHKQLAECLEACGHKLRVEPGPRIGSRPTIAEGSLGKLDVVMLQAVNLPIRLGYIKEAQKLRARISAETTLVRTLQNLSLQLNVFEMEEALALAASYQITGPLVDKVEKRLADVKTEMPIKEKLQEALDHDELEGLQAAVKEAREKGKDKPVSWTMPSGAAVMEKAVERMEELEEELRKYLAFLAGLNKEVEEHVDSTDLQACQDVLSRVAAANIKMENERVDKLSAPQKNDNVDKLSARVAALEIHLELHRQMQAVLSSDNIAELEALLQKAEEQGLRDGRWTLPSGKDDLANVEARIKKLKEQAEAKALAAKQAQDKLKMDLKAGLEAVEYKYLQELVQDGEKEFPAEKSGEFPDEVELIKKLHQRLATMKVEMDIIAKLQAAMKSYTTKEEYEPLRGECQEKSLADNKDGWILQEGHSAWEQMESLYQQFMEKEEVLKTLVEATANMDAKKIELGLEKAAELGVDQDALKKYNTLSGKLANTNQVRDLMLKNKDNETAVANLKARLEELQTKEDGGHSMIEMSLQRLLHSNNTDQMRQALRKAERGDFNGDIVDEVRVRCINLERQQPQLQKLQQSFWHGNFDELKKAIEDFKETEGPDNMEHPEDWPCEGLKQFYENACQKLQTLEEERKGFGEDEQSVMKKLKEATTSTNPAELTEVLEDAKQAKIEDPMVEELGTRLKTLEKQQALLQKMRESLMSRGMDKLQKVLEEIVKEGLDTMSNWLIEEGPSQYYVLTGYLKELEASQQKQSDASGGVLSKLAALNTSTDIHEIKQVLAQAKTAKVESALVPTLTKRVENLESQQGILKELKGMLRSTDAEKLQEVVEKARKNGLDNVHQWVWPDGPKTFTKVITRKLYCQQIEDIESRIKKAYRVYNVRELEACFREAEQIDLPLKFDKFDDAKRLLLRLQNSEEVEKLVEELRRKASDDEDANVAEINEGITFLMQHLLDLGLMTDNSALQDVAESMAHSKRKHRRRRKSASGRERAESVHATREAAEKLRAMLVEDLSNYKQLRDPLAWDTHNSTNPEEIRRAMVSHQTEKLTHSLTIMKPFNEKVALQNFIDLLRCMGDKPSSYMGDKHEPIIKRLTMSKGICDEIYIQVMKQLGNNPSAESSSKGWELLKVMVKETLPSPDVYLFLRAFIKRGSHSPGETTGKKKVFTALGDKKDWRQQLLSSVRADLIKQKQEEEEEDGLAGLAAKARMARRKSLPAQVEDRQEDKEENREMQMVKQATLASEIMDLLPDEDA